MNLEPSKEIFCYNCKKAIPDVDPADRIKRRQECDYCQSSLRCCLMCVFYEKSYYNECREPMADRIVDKERPNFCDFYRIRSGESISADEAKQKQIDAAMALFKK